MTVSIIIPGPPTGKARPRVAHGHAYTPESTRAYENHIQAVWHKAGRISFGADKPLCAAITAYHAIPASATRRDREAMERNTILPMKKPDADNIAKIVLDALNGLAYGDDKQIVRLEVVKRYTSGAPFVRLELAEVTPDGP